MGELRRLAEGATKGPWTAEEYGDEEAPTLVIHKDRVNRICFMATPGSYGDPAKIEADAAYIAAANPTAIIALLDRMAELEGARRECADDLASSIDGHYENLIDHPAMRRRYDRDMEVVVRARAVLERRSP